MPTPSLLAEPSRPRAIIVDSGEGRGIDDDDVGKGRDVFG